MSKRIAALTAISVWLVVASRAQAQTDVVTLVLTGNGSASAPFACEARPNPAGVAAGGNVQFKSSMSVNGKGVASVKTPPPISTLVFRDPGKPQVDRFEVTNAKPQTTPRANGNVGDTWNYKIEFFDASGKSICHQDPQICIKDATGSCTVTVKPPHPTPKPKPTAKPPRR